MKLVITTAFKFTTVHCSRDIAPSDISCKLQEKEGGTQFLVLALHSLFPSPSN